MKYILGPMKRWHQRQPQYSLETAPSLFLIVVCISFGLCTWFYGSIVKEAAVPLIRAASQPDGVTLPNLFALLILGIIAATKFGYKFISKLVGKELYKRCSQLISSQKR